jgi:hypothetical protein
MVQDATAAGAAAEAARPLLFISHRHGDRPIADALRDFVTNRSGGRVRVYQSSSAQAEAPRAGRELQRELIEHLWAANVVLLVYTGSEEDWSYCMWECGVATHPHSPETKVVVLQCGSRAPAVYGQTVRVNARNATDLQRLVNDFLTSRDFFPGYGQVIAPGFAPNGEEVRNAALQLAETLAEIVPSEDAEEGEDWPTVPFMRLRLTYAEVDKVRELDAGEGRKLVRNAARVIVTDGQAKMIFGFGRVQKDEPLTHFIESWLERRRDDTADWIDDLCEQLRVGGHWRFPRFAWQTMHSVDDNDSALYAPVLMRVCSVPQVRCHDFDVYFVKVEGERAGHKPLPTPLSA